MLAALLAGAAGWPGLEVAHAQTCNAVTGSPPSQAILGPSGEQFYPQNTNCPDQVVAPQCAGGAILRYVDPADPNQLTRYACAASPADGQSLPLIVHFHGSKEATVDVEFSGYAGAPAATNLLASSSTASLAPGKTGYALLMPQGRCTTAPDGSDGPGMHHDAWFKDPVNNLDVRAAQAFLQQLSTRTTLDAEGNTVPLPATLATVDFTRVYLSGISNGAFFAHLMGLYFPQQFAAGATAAGADPFARQPCPVPHPPAPRQIPVMVVHATCDPVVLCTCRGCDTGEATVEQWFQALTQLGWPKASRNDVITDESHTQVVGVCEFTSTIQQRLCPRTAHGDYPNAQLPSMYAFLQKFALSSALGETEAAGPSSPSRTGPQRRLLDGAVLSGNRVVGAGHGPPPGGSDPRFMVVAVGNTGHRLWTVTFTGAGGGGQGTAFSVVADAQDHVYAGGAFFPAQGPQGVVLRLDDRGRLQWQVAPVASGKSEVMALALDATGVYATGYAQVPGAPGEFAHQGIFLAKLDPATGNVLWLRVVESHPDPLGITGGLSVTVGPLGRVAVTGATYRSAATVADWFVGVWDGAGTQIWQDVRDGGAGEVDVARKGRFDGAGNLYAAGRLELEGQGADLALLKYDAGGTPLWQYSRTGTVSAQPASSFDEAKDLFVAADQIWLVGALTRSRSISNVREGILISFSPGGDKLWEQDFAQSSSSGEDITSVIADAAGNAYVAGTGSSSGIGKDLVVEKIDKLGGRRWSRVLEFGQAGAGERDIATRILAGAGDHFFIVGAVSLGDTALLEAVVGVDGDGNVRGSSPPTIHKVRDAGGSLPPAPR